MDLKKKVGITHLWIPLTKIFNLVFEISGQRNSSPRLRHYNSMPRKSAAEKARQMEKFIALSNQNSTLKKKLSSLEPNPNHHDNNIYRSLRHTKQQQQQQQQQQLGSGPSPVHSTNRYTPFLERTVTFKSLTCFSSLLGGRDG